MRFLQSTAIAILAAPAAWAADGDVCGAALMPADIVGAYSLTVGNAIMTGGGRIVPLKAETTSPVTILQLGDDLVMEGAGNAVNLGFVGRAEPPWQWDDASGMAAISSQDFELVTGCKIEALPRLAGTGMSQSTEGTPITFTYRLIVWSLDDGGAEMFGALEWSGGGIIQKRVVFLEP